MAKVHNWSYEVRLLKAKIHLGTRWQGHPAYKPDQNPQHPRFGAQLKMTRNGKYPMRVYRPGSFGILGDYSDPAFGWKALVVIAAALALLACVVGDVLTR